jgi:hypothetical protein
MTGGAAAGAAPAGAGASGAVPMLEAPGGRLFGLGAIGIVEMTRGAVFDGS